MARAELRIAGRMSGFKNDGDCHFCSDRFVVPLARDEAGHDADEA